MKRMLALAVSIAALSMPLPAQAVETYTFDPMHTSVWWSINHFGFSHPSGKFTGVEGKVTLDEAKPENSKVEAAIAIKNLVTGIDKLDAHLKSADFFDASTFPTAAFVSDKVDVLNDKMAKVHGNLTLHGVTRPVVLDVALNKIGESPITKKKTAGFTAAVPLKRSEFGIEKYLPGLGDDVQIVIEAEAALP